MLMIDCMFTKIQKNPLVWNEGKDFQKVWPKPFSVISFLLRTH